jgi:hypothetical protein
MALCGGEDFALGRWLCARCMALCDGEDFALAVRALLHAASLLQNALPGACFLLRPRGFSVLVARV